MNFCVLREVNSVTFDTEIAPFPSFEITNTAIVILPEITNQRDSTGPTMDEGILIALEGIDGSGHSTQARRLRRYLERNMTISDDERPIAVRTREPTDGPVGGEIREHISGRLEVDSETLALMFAADRKDHFETELRELVEEGKIVILDRYKLSSLAYQGVEVEDDEWLLRINSKAPNPDLTILLDVSPTEALKRMERDRVRKEIFETEEKLYKVKEKYLDIAKKLKQEGEDIYIIEGDKSIEEVSYKIRNRVARMIRGDERYKNKFTDMNSEINDYIDNH